ncbi:MAG: ribonuclease P protein component [Saprospiraceae bacterium]|nr:ribonuclease P protein component [Saprospiraceae bacterium]MBP9056705.1 ribonuclease P protein component [Saprospiraceae bacterium]
MHRLKGDKIIEGLFEHGNSVFVHPIKLMFRKSDNKSNLLDDQLFVGVSVSKRNFKNAVDRNRIKRILREAIRQNQAKLVNHQHLEIMAIYISKEEADFHRLVKVIEKLFRKIV